MAEPQARRYLTRARAKAEDSTVENRLPYQWKASTDSTAPRVTRATKRAAPSRAIESAASAHVAPKRKTTKNGAVAKKSSIVAPSKQVKKVTFNDDKENLIPATPRREEPPAEPERNADETDELMSSMGALSVKPLRVPATKLRLPTTNMNVSSAFDPMPALSPSKARRPLPTPRGADDPDMEDELSSPIPKLAAKPIRPIGLSSPTRGLGQSAKKPLDLTASLTSPARRPPTSPFKLTTANTPFSKLNGGGPRSEITSPARRPPPPTFTAAGNQTKNGIKLGPSVTLKMEIPDLSRPGIKSPAKRPKVPIVFKADESEDELGMDMEDYNLGRLPTRVPKKRVQIHRTPEDIAAQENTIFEKDEPTTVKHERKEMARSSTPPSPVHDDILGEKVENDDLDAEGDTEMDDADESELMEQIALSPTKYKSPTQGSNSYGFFSLRGDSEEEDEVSPAPFTGNPFANINLQPSERKTLFPNPQIATPKEREAPVIKESDASIPIDPFLLTLDAPANPVRPFESPLRTMKVPVKMHSIDDDLSSEDEEDGNEDGENAIASQLSSQSSTRSNVIRPAGVLAGAVVFVDVYTSEGADASAAFVETLRGLGAKVLKSWNWNPNSNGAPGEGERKVGITHVVFKDGSPRTLQKVKESKGVVLCVGVAWVTACEDEQSWVEESIYPVDLDHVPRGGHRHRKSMEPKALSMTPGGSSSDSANSLTSKTPKAMPRKIVFPQTELPNRIADETNPVLMHNLLLARRKSMQFAPKIGSPLRRFTQISMD
ncbi:uncharacterized protein LAJ45_03216 [Morchella importuna]|uniref:uncharacterized protein n=1 Tax=Morchella importuna TaxID=1174673 RepID=UPI001E8DBE3A|nr:uncharacterized protein LAJ45_03216 [Morchella importuna]KAH8152376.1 hypothetical protein LAJ45_03216 [Morchella importuna]